MKINNILKMKEKKLVRFESTNCAPLNNREIIDLKAGVNHLFKIEYKSQSLFRYMIKLKKNSKLFIETKDKSLLKYYKIFKFATENKMNILLEEISKQIIGEQPTIKRKNETKSKEILELKIEHKANIEKIILLKKEGNSFLKQEKTILLKYNKKVILKAQQKNQLNNKLIIKEKSSIKGIYNIKIKAKFVLTNNIKIEVKNILILQLEFFLKRKKIDFNKKQKENQIKNRKNYMGFISQNIIIKEILFSLFFSLLSFFCFIFMKEENKRREKRKEGNKMKDVQQIKIDKNKKDSSMNKNILRILYKEKKEIKKNNNDKKIMNIISFRDSANVKNIIYLILIFIQIVLPINKFAIFEYKSSNIKLKINGIGNKNVFSDLTRYFPNKIYINGEMQQIINYSYYFNQTYNNVELIWDNPISNCVYLFYKCSDIVEIDLSNFDTSILVDMGYMFTGCSGLSSLNLSTFNTSKVSSLYFTFSNCSGLSSLDLSNFNTSRVNTMSALFDGCSGISSLDLSNFDTSMVLYMNSMFRNCPRLSYLNLKSFSENASIRNVLMFDLSPNNIVICLNDNSNKILSAVMKLNCYTLDCSDNWELKYKKIVNETNICLNNNDNDILYKYEYNGKYYEKCENGTLINDNVIKNCKCDTEKCLSCPNEPLKEDLCIICNNNYYEIENDNYFHIEGFIKCYKNPEGYYLDKNESIYKKCYHTCKECDKKGDNKTHNCIKCNDNYSNEILINNYSNCYENCSFYYYFDNENDYHCTVNSTCPDNYLKYFDTKECIKNSELTTFITEINNDPFKTTGKIEDYELNETFFETEYKDYDVIDNQSYNSENTESIYKNCYFTCKECDKEGDNTAHNCITCNDNYPYEVRINNYSNCFNETEKTENMIEYYENASDSLMIQNEIKTYKLINNDNITQKIISINSGSDVIYECLLDDTINNNCNFVNIKNNTEIFDIIKNNLLAIYNPENNKSQIIKGEENVIFQITNTKNELELLKGDFLNNQNISILDLGQCEKDLKAIYNINESDSLICIKSENVNAKASDKNIRYEIYHPHNFSKLNLSFCKDNTINIYVKGDLSKETQKIHDEMKSLGYDMFNINDPFYQDICTPYKSPNNTDILLSDRIDYIYNNEDAQCQPNCHFSNYLPNSFYVNCTCEIVEDNKNEEVKFSGKKIFESFFDILKYSNFKIMKCYKLVFNKNVFTKNIGSIIIFIIFSFYLVCVIFFIIMGIEPLKNKLKEITVNTEEKTLKKDKIFICETLTKKDKSYQEKEKNKYKINFPPIRKTQFFHSNLNNNIKKSKKEKKKYRIKNINFFILPKSLYDDNNYQEKNISPSSKNIINTDKTGKMAIKNKLNKNENVNLNDNLNISKNNEEKKKLDAFELNELDYEEAILEDDRTFLQTYLDILCREHKIIFTFIICM